MRNTKRLREILRVVSEEGFHFLAHESKLSAYIPFTHRFRKKEKDLPDRLRKACERLGPTFIKFGQLLSMRPDFIPSEYANELKKLQDEVAPCSYSDIKKVIESDLKQPLEKVFRSFSKKPVASASLAQVHVAFLKSGKRVAVKVQRPGVRETINEDIELLSYLAHLLEDRVEGFKRYRASGAVKEFAERIGRELDFKHEARKYETFCELFKDSDVIFPRPVWHLTTEKVLVMDYIEGVKVSEFKGSRHVALQVFDAWFTMGYRHGIFHADPHPGNILVVGKRIAFLDVGMVGYLPEAMRSSLQEWFANFLEKKFELMADYMVEVSDTSAESDISGFKHDAISIASAAYSPLLEHADVKESFFKLIDSAIAHRIYPKPELVMFIRAAVILEGVAFELAPDLRFEEDLLPIVRKASAREVSVRRIARNYAEVFEHLPETAKALAKTFSDARLKVNLEATELVSFERVLDRTGVNIAFGFIIGALLVTGSLSLDFPYTLFNVSVVSFFSFLLAVLFLLWIFFRVVNVKKLLHKLLR